MKKFIIIITLAIAALTCTAGNVVRNNNSIRVEQAAPKEGEQATAFCYEDSDGKYYTIYQGPKGGMFYYKRAKSGKHAGELTKRYLTKEDKEKYAKLAGGK